LDPSVLTLGFARRFATYKRADLIFYDWDRLRKLLSDRWRPIQIIFAGKAHPADDSGKQILQLFLFN
jgi:starch phosphorylase